VGWKVAPGSTVGIEVGDKPAGVGTMDVKPVIVGWPVAPTTFVGFGEGAKSAGVGT